MKLEVDDLKWTGRLSVASVIDCLDNRVLVHFDGRDSTNCVWLAINSPYLHPHNYHKTLRNKNLLVPPPGKCFLKDILSLCLINCFSCRLERGNFCMEFLFKEN